MVKTGDTLSKIGDEVNYTITVYNNSSADTPAMAFDIVDAPLGINVVDQVIANGGNYVINKAFVIQEGAADPYVNTVNVHATVTGFPNTYDDSDSWSTNLFQPSITLTKVGSKTMALAGEWVHYTITVTNTSSSDTPNLVGDVYDSWYDYLGTVNFSSASPGNVVVFEYDRQMPTWADTEHPAVIHNDAWVDASPVGFPNVIHAEDDWDVQIIYYHDETAWAFGGEIATRFTSLNALKSDNWGWSNNIGTGAYTSEPAWQLWAGAAMEDLSKGTLVGTVSVSRVGTTITVTYHTNGTGMNDLLSTHLWVGTTMLPKKGSVYLNDPGQFENKKYARYSFTKERMDEDTIVYVFTGVPVDADIWIAAHSVARMYYLP